MKSKLLNFILIIIFALFFIHFFKDVTQDILKIATPLDYLGDVKEILSSFSLTTRIIYFIFGVLSVIGEIFLVVTIPMFLYKKKIKLLKSIYIVTILLIIYFLTIYSFLFFNPSNFYFSTPSKEFINYSINNTKYKLLIADEQKEWEKGLMFYKSKKELNGADGMIFIFPEKQVRSFWNKNTYLDLDVYWLEDNKVVGKSFLPSILKLKETVVVKSPDKVNRVVEIIF